jgi:hypothetical protein
LARAAKIEVALVSADEAVEDVIERLRRDRRMLRRCSLGRRPATTCVCRRY